MVLGGIIVIFLILIYLLYLRVMSPARFSALWNFGYTNFIKGYLASGMPTWWVNFASSYVGKFIRYVGSICYIIMRSIIPVNPGIKSIVYDYELLIYFFYAMNILFIVYFGIFCICNVYSGLKYSFNLEFVVRNSPIAATIVRALGSTAKVVGLGMSGVFVYGGSVPGFDDIQRKVFDASEDKLLSTKMRSGVDAIKEVTGYSNPSTSTIKK